MLADIMAYMSRLIVSREGVLISFPGSIFGLEPRLKVLGNMIV